MEIIFIKKLENEDLGNLEIYQGISEVLISQVIKYANTDHAIKVYTRDPSRFKDKLSFNEWLQKGRSIYILTNKANDLYGIIWFGNEMMPSEKQFISDVNTKEYGVTFAIRIYAQARGKHLARKFMNVAFNVYHSSSEYRQIEQKGIWLETSADNYPALNAFKKFGFTRVTVPDDKNKILMIFNDEFEKNDR